MRVLIRADASVAIGTGHILRCAALAEKFVRRGDDVIFICREQDGHLSDFLRREKGFAVVTLPFTKSVESDFHHSHVPHASWLGVTPLQDAAETSDVIHRVASVDLFIIDHYAIDAEWESVIKPQVKKMFVIDDLADRAHVADVLLDQNYYHHSVARYEKLVPVACQKLLGPKYALLPPHFMDVKKNASVVDFNQRQLFVFFGGSDPEGVTLKAVEALKSLSWQENEHIEVLVGPLNPHREAIKKLCAGFTPIHLQLEWVDVAKILNQSQMFLGAGGVVTWERSFFGIPSVVVATAQNQIQIAKEYAEVGAQVYLGFWQDVTVQDIKKAVSLLWTDKVEQEKQRLLSQRTVDGHGLDRVMSALLGVVWHEGTSL